LFLQTPPALILASTSTYRRALLERLGIAFKCHAPGIDEQRAPGEAGFAMAKRLALAKARAVAAQFPDAWVIGSDQVAAVGDGPVETLLGKPKTAEGCRGQLRASSARTVRYLTAVTLLRHADGQCRERLDTTQVRFRTLDDATIERYVEREAPLDCAGAFKSEGLGITLCTSIETQDPTALIGLPLIALAGLLREVGFLVP